MINSVIESLGDGPPPGLTIERFSDIVGQVYECALEPERWGDALASVCEGIGGSAGWIGTHQPKLVRSDYEVEFGTDPEWQRRLREQYVAVSPFIGITHHVRPGEVWSVADAIDYSEYLQTRFYLEWSQPQGWGDTIMGVLTKSPDRFNWLGVCLQRRAEAAHKARVAHFLPHMARALRISQLLEFRAAQAADLMAAVESLATGILTLDAELGVRGINPAAERMMRETGALSANGGKLRLPVGEDGDKLATALAACAGAHLDHAGISVLPAARDGGVGLLVQVAPLPRLNRAHGHDAVAALFLSAPGAPRDPPMDAFVRRFRLTPSETRVLLALQRGETPRGIAEANGLALPTIRTHLSRLFDKTGTRGQTELVRLLTSMTAAT